MERIGPLSCLDLCQGDILLTTYPSDTDFDNQRASFSPKADKPFSLQRLFTGGNMTDLNGTNATVELPNGRYITSRMHTALTSSLYRCESALGSGYDVFIEWANLV